MKVGNFFCTTHISSDFSVNPFLTSVFDHYKVPKMCNSNGIFIIVVSSSSSSGVTSLQDSLWSLWDHGISVYKKVIQFNLRIKSLAQMLKLFTISMSLSLSLSLSVSRLSCSTVAMCRFLQPSTISIHVLFSFPSLLLCMNWWISLTLHLILQFFLLINFIILSIFLLSRVYFLLN